jgi:hypothetical protein
MIVSVVRNYHWTPEVIGKLYIDDIDYQGLIFWYEDAKEMNKLTKP